MPSEDQRVLAVPKTGASTTLAITSRILDR